jgi:hypothetical protein
MEMTENYKEFIKVWGDRLSDNQHAMLKPFYFAKICDYKVEMSNESYIHHAYKKTLMTIYFKHPEYEATIKLYV